MVCLGLALPAFGQKNGGDLQNYDLNFAKGLVKFGDGQYEESEKLFRNALKAKPGDPEAMDYLGQTLIRLKKYSDAELIYRDMLAKDPGSGRAFLGLGIAQYHQGKFDDALTSLAAAEKALPDNALVYFYQGLTYNKQMAFDRSPPRFARAMALGPDLTADANFQSGVAYYQKGIVDEAKTAFETVIETDPKSDLAASARKYLDQIKGVRVAGPKAWDLSFIVSPQYDNNVVLTPLGTAPPAGDTGIARTQDYRTTMYVRGEYRPIMTEHWVAGGSYSFYQSFHRTLSAFDVESHEPVGYIQYQLGRVQTRLQYTYDYVKVGRAPYLISEAVNPIVTITESPNAYLQFQFRYQYKDFKDTRFSANATRDAKNYLAGVIQYYLFAEKEGNVRVGFTFDKDVTGGTTLPLVTSGSPRSSDWAYNGYRVTSGVTTPLVWKTNLDLAYDYYRQSYRNPNSYSFSGSVVRKDDIHYLTGTLSRDINSWLTAALQYSYTRDQANIPAFDYNRSVYSLLLNGHF